MRQRTTFIHRPGDAVDPALLQISADSLSGPVIKAAREDRLTLALDDLPSELQTLLRDTRKLHIRWASSRLSESVSPLFSTLPPGFHLFYSPLSSTGKDTQTLCEALSTAFGDVDCSSPEESFTTLPHERSSRSTTFQYFQPLESVSKFARYAVKTACSAADESCAAQVERLSKASSLDISYDAIVGDLKITARWPYQAQTLRVPTQQYRTEVGILAEDKPPNLEPQELGLSGLLTVLGQDSAPSPTLFSFPSRHRHAEGSFSAKFLSPTGMHPTLQITLESTEQPSKDSTCSPYAYLTLPRSIFPDKYQLADDLLLASKNLTALRYVSQPVDLEAPEYAMKLWGSAILLELSPPTAEKPKQWSVEVPLHLRYLAPSQGGYQDIDIPYPAVFWACEAVEGTQFATNPFDQASLGYDGFFEPSTAFWHVDPRPSTGEQLINRVTVPVLDLDKSKWVNRGTAAAIIIGFAWIVWKLLPGLARPNNKGEAARPANTENKKMR